MRDILVKGLAQLGLSDHAVPQLEAYTSLLLEKNKVMNLTAITAPQEVATLHLLDCAALLTMADLRGKRAIDVGTGAGFPGMVLRIMEPDFDLTLLDSLGKRIDFLREVCASLALERVDCVHARAEEFAADHRQQYDVAMSRAVANLNVLCELALPLVKVGGQFLAMKSVSSDQEIQGARGAIGQLGGRIADIRDYTVPETQVRHRLVVIEKVKDRFRVDRVEVNDLDINAVDASGTPNWRMLAAQSPDDLDESMVKTRIAQQIDPLGDPARVWDMAAGAADMILKQVELRAGMYGRDRLLFDADQGFLDTAVRDRLRSCVWRMCVGQSEAAASELVDLIESLQAMSPAKARRRTAAKGRSRRVNNRRISQ